MSLNAPIIKLIRHFIVYDMTYRSVYIQTFCFFIIEREKKNIQIVFCLSVSAFLMTANCLLIDMLTYSVQTCVNKIH